MVSDDHRENDGVSVEHLLNNGPESNQPFRLRLLGRAVGLFG
jgi:hypothetical protein